MKNDESILDKAYGALIGHAIGDSFGDASRTPRIILIMVLLLIFQIKMLGVLMILILLFNCTDNN